MSKHLDPGHFQTVLQRFMQRLSVTRVYEMCIRLEKGKSPDQVNPKWKLSDLVCKVVQYFVLIILRNALSIKQNLIVLN